MSSEVINTGAIRKKLMSLIFVHYAFLIGILHSNKSFLEYSIFLHISAIFNIAPA